MEKGKVGEIIARRESNKNRLHCRVGVGEGNMRESHSQDFGWSSEEERMKTRETVLYAEATFGLCKI